VEPTIRYAMNGDVAIAFETFGEGAVDVLYLAPINNLEIMWENPLYARFLRQLADISRVIVMDRRGTGLSDRFSPNDLPPLEDLVDDIVTVLDAAGSERAILFGFSDAGAQCAMVGATRPERVAGLVLFAAAASGKQQDDYGGQWTEEEWDAYLDFVRTSHGTEEFSRRTLEDFLPSHVDDGRIAAWWTRFWRLAVSRNGNLEIERINRDLDIRASLGVIDVPTLVMHRTDDMVEPVDASRFIATRIREAHYVELPGADHLPWAGDQDAVLHEVERFVGALRDSQEFAERVLATVLFTDIVESTQKAAALGDTAWKALLARHDELAQREVERHRGRYVNTTGDGMLATFDGPARAVRCAQAIADVSKPLGLEIRAGCHTGEVEPAGDDIRGLAVHIGARIAALADASELWVSSTVKDLTVGSGLKFEDAGEYELKGVPDRWHLYRVSA
jgi:pimeloyl-ACP methyl ester carboxylesterase